MARGKGKAAKSVLGEAETESVVASGVDLVQHAVFFWGGTKTKEEWSFLSNFSAHGFYADGEYFARSEQYFGILKAREFGQKKTVELLFKSTSGTTDVKLHGKKAIWETYDDAHWGKMKDEVMRDALRFKFIQHELLGQQLLDTGDRYIAEASPTDKYWGIGMAAEKARLLPTPSWKGKNMLGRILMEVRSNLADPNFDQTRWTTMNNGGRFRLVRGPGFEDENIGSGTEGGAGGSEIGGDDV